MLNTSTLKLSALFNFFLFICLLVRQKHEPLNFSVEKDEWLVLLVFFSYLKWINSSDKILAGRVISRQVEYQKVYQPQKGDQNYYRFGAFSVEIRETKYCNMN